MRITQLSLTNFRSFRDTQTIDIAPVTLLVGPNSVGKSTVLMALFYVQQILERGQCDPQHLDALGNKFVGGFKQLVHGQDLSKDIVIRVEYEKTGEVGAGYTEFRDYLDESEELVGNVYDLGLQLDAATINSDKVAIELTISWSEKAKTAYVARYAVWLDSVEAISASSDSGLKQPIISSINFNNLKFISDEIADAIAETDVDSVFIVPSDIWEEIDDEQLEADFDDDIEMLYFDKKKPGRAFGSPFKWYLALNEAVKRNFAEKNFGEITLSYQGYSGAIPSLGKLLVTQFQHENNDVVRLINEILSNAFVAPLDNLLLLLNDSICIGPLRTIPNALYQINPYPEQKDWYSGSAAWDVVGRSATQLERLNYWLGPNGFDIGYSIRNKTVVSQSFYLGNNNEAEYLNEILNTFGDELEVTISSEDIDENPESDQKNIDLVEFREFVNSKDDLANTNSFVPARNVNRSVVLWDNRNKIEVFGAEVGVGVSQLFPLVVAVFEARNGFIACEQPELHVHPRIQVEIGDLLTQTGGANTLLIETHSEHLILRILKRISQTTDNDLPINKKPVTPEQISIIYLESTSEGVEAKKIQIDKDGEFIEKWPQGFFSERANELF